MNVHALEDLKQLIVTLAELARCKLSLDEIDVQFQSAPHRPPSALPANKQAIYMFFYDCICLKVGKAGPLSAARFISHHYGPHAPNTLPKSIIKAKDRLLQIVGNDAGRELQPNDEKLVGQWLKKHTGRANVLIPASAGPHVLSLIEAFLHCRLQPLFEGRG